MSITREWVICCHVWPVLWNGHEGSIFQTIQVCHKSFTSVCYYWLHFCLQNYPLIAYYVPYSCVCQYLLKYNIYKNCNILPNQHMSYGPVFWLIQSVKWGLYVNCSSGDMEHICGIWQTYLLLSFCQWCKYMYTGTPDHPVDCSEFIWDIYIDIVAVMVFLVIMCMHKLTHLT